MGKFEITLPAMGEGIIEATITKWFVNEGDEVAEDDPLLEVATDKVDSELPSPYSGKILQIVYREGEIPKIGEVLAILENSEIADIESEPAPIDESGKVISKTAENKAKLRKEKDISLVESSAFTISNKNSGELHLTPYVRFLAKDRGLSIQELKLIKGTGQNNRITREDINNYLRAGRLHNTIQSSSNQDQGTTALPYKVAEEKLSYQPTEGEKIIPMDRTRKLIAEHMVQSKKISPHVTSMVELDVTSLVIWREKNKLPFMEKHGVKLTYTPIILEAVVKALKDYPGINISVVGENIVQKSYINIGVATALPDGNLIVPVVKDADKRNFVNLTSQIADLALRAREGRLNPSEIRGGTFTITNMGQYDNVSGTPIINQPEVAILAIGAIKKKPGVIYVNEEPTMGIRDILVLSLTYDHRVVDGALGGSFVRAVGKYLESITPKY